MQDKKKTDVNDDTQEKDLKADKVQAEQKAQPETEPEINNETGKKADNQQNSQKRNYLKNIIRVFVLFILIAIIYMSYYTLHQEIAVRDIFENVEKDEANLTEYIVYGNHLNLKGNIKIENSNINKLSLCLKTLDDENDITFPLTYQNNSNEVYFYTSNFINEGIDLEKIEVSNYFVFIKVEYKDKKDMYYSLNNTTEYKEIEYYTLTKNKRNNKIKISFNTRTVEESKLNYMYINVIDTKLPENVYDIVIDPGHGGEDVGAQENGYKEADLTLHFAKKVKKELENMGLKIKITRDGTEGKKFNVYSVYDEDGRVNMVGKSKAKYVFSIHLNSVQIPNSQRGVEIYAPTNMNLNFAKSLADSIVKYGNSRYSDLDVDYKVDEGVYVRKFKKSNIDSTTKEAIKKGYKPYDIKEDTPYLYMLRETGGIATKAYVDGRNSEYGKNLFYNSNIGVEAYLLELGYINNKEELDNMLSNDDGYVNGIVNAIRNEIFAESSR